MAEEKINHTFLEICANSTQSAFAAQAGGASRVEFCQSLELGGTTASYAQLLLAREQLHIGVHALIRPRAGDFLYNSSEIEEMLSDIRFCRSIGIDGVVIGALKADGQLDISLIQSLITAAEGMHITFHRAFDCCADPFLALEQLIDLGVSRILSSGLQPTAMRGKELLRKLIEVAKQHIDIMPGAGVNADNIAELLRYTGAQSIHSSAKVVQSSAMIFENPALDEMKEDTWVTSKEKVRQLADILKNL